MNYIGIDAHKRYSVGVALNTEGQEVEEIVLAHPLKTRLIADAQIKTDKLDARALAGLLR